MKNKKIIFTLIAIFCVFALMTGIYTEFFIEDSKNNIQEPNKDIELEEKQKSQDEIKEQLTNLFTNEFIINSEYNIENIQKKNSEQDLVYSAFDVKEQNDNYEIDIHLPVINIKGDVPTNFNQVTQSIFADKATEIVNNQNEEKTFFNVDYIAYINGEILSVAIRSTLKQGSNPQRVVMQTYNYNLTTGTSVKIEDVLSNKNIIQSDCKNEINNVVTKAQEEANILVESGYTVYNRDLNNDMYQIENINNFFLGENGELYIIFAYGNQNLTAEMDVILYE